MSPRLSFPICQMGQRQEECGRVGGGGVVLRPSGRGEPRRFCGGSGGRTRSEGCAAPPPAESVSRTDSPSKVIKLDTVRVIAEKVRRLRGRSRFPAGETEAQVVSHRAPSWREAW